MAAAGPRQNTELDFRQPDLSLRVIGGDAVVAREREFESAAEAGAVNSDGDRLGKAGHAIQHVLTVGRQAFRFGGRAECDKLLDVGAGDEVVGLAGEKGDGAHARIVGQRGEAGQELVLHGPGNDVDRLPFEIEHDGRDAVADLPRDGGRSAGWCERRH